MTVTAGVAAHLQRVTATFQVKFRGFHVSAFSAEDVDPVLHLSHPHPLPLPAGTQQVRCIEF